MKSARSTSEADEEDIVADLLLGSASHLMLHRQEQTYGLDYWKNQFKTSEVERESLQSQLRSTQRALKDSLDHQARLLRESEAAQGRYRSCSDAIVAANNDLSGFLEKLGFNVNSNLDERSDAISQMSAYTQLVSFLVKLRSGEVDGHGIPVTWTGALATLDSHLKTTYVDADENFREAKLSNLLKDITHLTALYGSYLNDDLKRSLLTQLTESLFAPEFQSFRDDAKKNLEVKNESLPEFIHQLAEDNELFPSSPGKDDADKAPHVRVSNLRMELAAEKEVTKELREKLHNSERDLENALLKYKSEKLRLDEISSRDEANDARFKMLSKQLDLLVKGDLKPGDGSSKENSVDNAAMRREIDDLTRQIDLSNKRANEAERRLESVLKHDASLKSELASVQMSLSLKLDKKRIRCQSLAERVSDLEKVCSELYDQLQDSVTVSSKMENDNKMLRVQLDAMRGDKSSNDWIRDKLETQVGRSKALEDALAEMRRQLLADRQQLAAQAENCQRVEQRLVEMTEESMFMQKEYDRQKNRCDMLERDCERLDSMLTLAKQKISTLNTKIVDIQGNIRVLCRIRPILPEEWEKYDISEADINELVKYPDYNTLEFDGNPFEFDRVLPPSSKQRDVFEEVESVVRSVMNGSNACVIAYGETGSGKTFSLIGSGEGTDDNVDRGLVYRSLEALFDSTSLDVEMKSKFELSMIDIYNDGIKDLFQPQGVDTQHRVELIVEKRGFVIENMVRHPIASVTEAMYALEHGLEMRRVADFENSDLSSRSHLIIIVKVERYNLRTGETYSGQLYLADLAGSEKTRLTGATATGLRMMQSVMRSLSALSDVITALASRQRQVPYRASKLTMVLQAVLQENARVVTLININPIPSHIADSVGTLGFGIKCRKVVLGHAKRQTQYTQQMGGFEATNNSAIVLPQGNWSAAGNYSDPNKMPSLFRK